MPSPAARITIFSLDTWTKRKMRKRTGRKQARRLTYCMGDQQRLIYHIARLKSKFIALCGKILATHLLKTGIKHPTSAQLEFQAHPLFLVEE